MCNRLGTIPACDRQTDGQTSCHGIVRAMHTRRAVKTILINNNVLWQKNHLAFAGVYLLESIMYCNLFGE